MPTEAERTGAELAGLAVVTATGGERLGRLHDVVFDPRAGRVKGFLVDSGGVFAKARFLPALLVRSLGADAVVVEGGTRLEETAPGEGDEGAIAARSLEGRPVVSEAGTALGKVADVVVDTHALTVPALLLSTGLLDNVLHGKHRLPLTLVQAIGHDSLMVPTSYDPHAAAPTPPG